MAKADFDCAKCGDSVTIVGRNRSEADRKAKWHESQGHICQKCEKEQFQEQNAENAKLNQSSGLVQLTGSEKQIAWAETIRKDILNSFDEIHPFIETAKSVDFEESQKEQLEAIKAKFTKLLDSTDANKRYWLHQTFIEVIRASVTVDRFIVFLELLKSQTRASWWIDNRGTRLAALVKEFKNQIDGKLFVSKPSSSDQSDIQSAAQEEALLKPATALKSQQIAEIKHVGKELQVTFAEKQEDFRLLMRGMGFGWIEKHWVRTLGITTGNPIDRIAETAHRIIGSGFMVRLYDDAARAKAISGEFEAEQTRWITKSVGGDYAGWCCITWPKSDDLYASAKRILGARYKNGHIYAPPGSILEVVDFAEKYGFSLSPGVKKMLDDHKQALARGVVIDAPKKPQKSVMDDGTRQNLTATESTIHEDLKD